MDGEVKEMTRGELMTLVRGSDPDLRARAYQELYRVYGDDGPILGQMYQTIVRDWQQRGGHPAPLQEPDLRAQPGQRPAG